MEEKQKEIPMRNSGNQFVNILKVVGFIILAITPASFSDIFIWTSHEYHLPIWVQAIIFVIFLALYFILIRFFWNRYKTYSGERIKRIHLKDVGFMVLFFVIIQVIAYLGTTLNNMFTGNKTTGNDNAIFQLANYSDSFLPFLTLILSISIVAPILEEITFRGIITSKLFKYGRMWLPLIVSSIIFGSLHILQAPTEFFSFLLYTCMGAIFYLAYARRHNILDSILVHFLNNLLPAISLLLIYFFL
ncbi:CPBP family intramembrane glutamic endopeptidase [Staphylococcus auricularis]|uniref:Type II CAAX endopeptidase family protein n=1 Tax=Staphylococcus auricularis TaxID=29379 RepID=A0AAW7MDG7_9STAP|nr:type II CAAX endopeptidase family protein [Staphylococcus auricularis]MDC6327100.1 type II CAAX endopeptidase family protein [Staphylococcus auricularis]MDN4533189.1 type II CAAX endopeptidase family protein [Staphylococcus auricularis]MDN4533309.1 type II CAAX endopeptidase family protein [Staphylococcus auricularis]